MRRALLLSLLLAAQSAGCSTFAGMEEAERYDYEIRDIEEAEWRYVYCGVRRVGEVYSDGDPSLTLVLGSIIGLGLNAATDTAVLPITAVLELVRFQRLRRVISERRHEEGIERREPPEEGGIVRGSPGVELKPGA